MRHIFSIVFCFLVSLGSALKFDVPATQPATQRCIRNFVSAGQLVVVTALVSGNKGDGQVLNMHVRGDRFYRMMICDFFLAD